MITSRSTRALALLVLTAAAAAIAAGSVGARPDPGERRFGDSAQAAATAAQRPTGPAEGTRLGGADPTRSGAGAAVALPLADARELDWLSAGIGALAALAALGLAAGAMSVRRRGSDIRGAA